jgi:hypothetical protein
MASRTEKAMRGLAREAQAFGAEFIDFVKDGTEDVFSIHHDVYFAEDGLHPSPPAYGFCHDVLKSRVNLPSLLNRQPAPAPASCECEPPEWARQADIEFKSLLLCRSLASGRDLHMPSA